MSFILRRHGDGAYVARQGSSASYTFDPAKAQLFDTLGAAASNKCGNESVIEYWPARFRAT
jgi:hypothetical protein